jgi:coenzyme F420 hydrogenase subunit beta
MANPKSFNTVSGVINSGLCCGCGTCYALCPSQAINIQYNSLTGIYSPQISLGLCSNCGVCLKVCPGVEVNYRLLEKKYFGENRSNELIGVYRDCYTGYSCDNKLRFNSSSGGLITELLKVALETRLIAFSCITKAEVNSINKEIEIKPFLADSGEGVYKGIGSKYAPVPLNIAIKDILEKDGAYGIVGLPCHIHGIRKAQNLFPVLKKRIVFCIGLFCAKNIKLAGTYYLMKKLGIDLSEVKSLSYRGNGWPGGLTVEFLDGRNFFVNSENYYTSDFGAFIMPRCILCCDHSNELADLSCGDAWQKKFDDSLGTSVLLVRSSIGEKLVRHAISSKRIKLENTNPNEILVAQDMFDNKKRHITAAFKLWKILNKPLPQYTGIRFVSPGMSSYFLVVSTLIKNVLSSREKLWPLLRLFCKVTDFTSGLIKSRN